MYSHSYIRSLGVYCSFACLVLSASSCSHRSAPSVSRTSVLSGLQSRKLPAVVHLKARQPIAFPSLNTNQINSLTFSPDGRRLAFGYGVDAGISVWNLETGRLAWQRHVEAADGGPIQFGPSGRFLVAQFNDPDSDTPIIVSTTGGRLLRNLGFFSFGGRALLEKSGRFLVTGGSQADGARKASPYGNEQLVEEVWDTRTWHRRDSLRPLPKGTTKLLPLTASGKIIRRTRSKQTLETAELWHPPSEQYTYDDYSPDSRFLATADDEKRVELWDVRSRKRLWAQNLLNDNPRVPAISPDGRILAVATIYGSIYFWNLKTGRLLSKTHCVTDVLRCLAFSPNGRVLAAAGGLSYSGTGTGVSLLSMTSYQVFARLKVSLADNSDDERNWTLNNPDWFASLPDLSYLAPDSVIKKIRTPGRQRDAKIIAQFDRPGRVRAALRRCYKQEP